MENQSREGSSRPTGAVSPDDALSGSKRGREGDDANKRNVEARTEDNEVPHDTQERIAQLIASDLASEDLNLVAKATERLGNMCSASKQGDNTKAVANAKLFFELGGQTILLHLIQKSLKNEKTLKYILGAFCNSLKIHSKPSVLLGKRMVESVLRVMKAYPVNLDIQRRGIGCLCNLLSDFTTTEKQKQMSEIVVVKHEAIPVVEETSRRFRDDTELQCRAVHLICRLAKIDELRDTLRNDGGLVVLARGVQCFKGTNEELYKKAKDVWNLIA